MFQLTTDSLVELFFLLFFIFTYLKYFSKLNSDNLLYEKLIELNSDSLLQYFLFLLNNHTHQLLPGLQFS